VSSLDRRRKEAELYGEMFDSGYDPSRGLAPLIILSGCLALLSIGLLMSQFTNLMPEIWIAHVIDDVLSSPH
jgi:hypothetical protein